MKSYLRLSLVSRHSKDQYESRCKVPGVLSSKKNNLFYFFVIFWTEVFFACSHNEPIPAVPVLTTERPSVKQSRSSREALLDHQDEKLRGAVANILDHRGRDTRFVYYSADRGNVYVRG
jgi:hypothetical protein